MIIVSIILGSCGSSICTQMDEYYKGLGYVSMTLIIITLLTFVLSLFFERRSLKNEDVEFDNYKDEIRKKQKTKNKS